MDIIPLLIIVSSAVMAVEGFWSTSILLGLCFSSILYGGRATMLNEIPFLYDLCYIISVSINPVVE